MYCKYKYLSLLFVYFCIYFISFYVFLEISKFSRLLMICLSNVVFAAIGICL